MDKITYSKHGLEQRMTLAKIRLQYILKGCVRYVFASFLNRVPWVPACQHGLRASVFACLRGLVPTCLRASVVYVPTCQRVKSVPSSHFYVPTCHKARQCFNLACQRAKRRATFSIWHVNVPNGVPLFQTFLLRNAKKISILYYYMKNSTLYLISYLYISCVYVSYI